VPASWEPGAGPLRGLGLLSNPFRRLGLVTTAALTLALAVSPFVYHHYDVVDCFLTWARASRGLLPWEIYRPGFRTNCDYPPVVPYLLTATEAVRRAAGAAETGPLAVVLVKLPNILAWLAHVPLCWYGLARPFGTRMATRAAWLMAVSPPLFVNAALWGQFDALASLALVAAVVALLNGRPVWAGAAIGAGLATKLLVIVAVPLLALWVWRRHGARTLLAAVAVGLLVMLVLALPHAAGGATGPVLDAYRGAVGYYPLRTVEAYNGWYLADRVDIFLRGTPAAEARLDSRRLLGPVTHRHLGLALFTACTAYLLVRLARQPTAHGLVLATTLQMFAFFMLPTQMHQRYLVPAAALATLLAGWSRRAAILFVGLAVTATLNQGLDLWRAVTEHAVATAPGTIPNPPAVRALIRGLASAVALGNVGLFAWALATVRREMAPAASP
jgi:hypothetical protein